MIRIFIADDHEIFREGIKLIFSRQGDMAVVGEAVDGDQAVRQLLQEEYDVVLMDISMPGRNSLEVLRRVRLARPDMPFLMLTMHDNDMLAMRFLKAGAAGYLTKDCNPKVLVDAVRRVNAGRKHISPELAERILDTWDNDLDRPLHERLSDREFTVLCRLASGLTVSQVAQELSLSPQTVSTYRARILRKMEMTTNAELTRYAIQHNLVS